MTNKELLDILNKGIDFWNEWRTNSSIRIDLSGSDFTGARLSGVNFRRSILRGVDFSGADLRRAILAHSDLEGARFSQAHLREGSYSSGSNLWNSAFRRTDLRGADLQNANLKQTTFKNTNLSEANLRLADLRDALLMQVDLTFTDLNEATFGRTAIVDTDLKNVKGLETIKHVALSTIGNDTLRKTEKPLPELFLLGFGLSRTEPDVDYCSCYISYSQEDKTFARRVYDKLKERGIHCGIDEEQMVPGDDFYDQIVSGIANWDKLLLCCSKSSLSETWWVDNEIDTLFQKERDLMAERGKRVLALIPLNLDGYLMSKDEKTGKYIYDAGKSQQIRSRVAADFTGWEHNNTVFEREIERVIKALRIDGGHEIPPPLRL